MLTSNFLLLLLHASWLLSMRRALAMSLFGVKCFSCTAITRTLQWHRRQLLFWGRTLCESSAMGLVAEGADVSCHNRQRGGLLAAALLGVGSWVWSYMSQLSVGCWDTLPSKAVLCSAGCCVLCVVQQPVCEVASEACVV